MKKHYELWPFNFGAVKAQDFAKAKVVIVPVPYEGTVSLYTGTSAGPYAIIENSRYLDEMLDAVEKGKLVGLNSTDVYTLDEVALSKDSPREALQGVEQLLSEQLLKYDKFPLMLGGEHSITLGAVKALRRKYKDLSVLQFDAHTDLLHTFDGSQYSHACVMRRIRELGVPVVSLGIRNINAESEQYIKKKKLKNIFYMPKKPSAPTILKGLSKHVYLTFDLDCLDPSIMPSVGTPEPGGMGWYESLNIIEQVAKKVDLVGADVVELKPIPGLEAPNFLAAKLVYHILKSKIQASN